MKKNLSIILLLVMIMSCKNRFEAEYLFPDSKLGFYAIIFNSKNGIVTEKSKGKYEYNFKDSNILFAKEPRLVGNGKIHFYLMSAYNPNKKEISINDFSTNNNKTVVQFNIIGSYTNVETNKQVDYEIFWLAPNKKNSDKEQIEEDKRQNIKIQLLHKKIDSLVNAGLL